MGKTKTCDDCKAEIPANAKKCMHCGSTQPHIGWFGLLILIIFAIVVFSKVSDSIDEKEAERHAAPAPAAAKSEFMSVDEAVKSQQRAAKQAADKADKQAAARLSREKRQAQELCLNAVRVSARFPSSVDFSAWSSPPAQPMHGGGWIIRWAFTAKNGIGNTVPKMARCEIKANKLTHFSLQNR